MSSKQTSHFWVGHLPSQMAGEYFVETYDDDDDDAPISAFARDQGVSFYDHDFLEYGWGDAVSIPELVKDYSYSDQWSVELARRAAEAGLKDINFFAFINEEEIDSPQSVQRDDYWLRYLGTIEYRI